MASHKQIEANRRNAQRSTGPRTPEGKAAVCHNALATGIYATAESALNNEDPTALSKLAAEYHNRYAPQTPEQRCLVDCLVSDEWLLRRFRRIEGELLTDASETATGVTNKVGGSYYVISACLERLQRRINATRKSYLHTLKTLHDLQSTGPEPPAAPSARPERTTEAASNQPLAAPIGFVPPISARALTPPRPLAAHTPETVSSQLPCEPPPSSCLLPSPTRSL